MTPSRRGPRPPATPPEPDARERLIAAGYRVLSEQGYDATTVKEVAREAGVNQGLVHYYFGSKDALLLAVIEAARQKYARELQRLREETPPERLAAASFTWGEKLLNETPEQIRLRFELFALGLRNPELKPAVAELLSQSNNGIAQTVARVRGGNDDAQPDAVDNQYAAIVRACFDGLAMHHLMDAHFDPGPAFALLRKVVLASVEAERAKAPARKGKTQARRGARPLRRRR